MIEGKRFAIQVLAVFDPDLFDRLGRFAAESSLVVVLQSKADRWNCIDAYALRVITKPMAGSGET